MNVPVVPPEIVYPESDGKPMADNTIQFRWIQVLAGNLMALYVSRRDDVFVGGDLFWYPVQNFPNIVQAPDVFVVFGRPQRDRGSYRQWEEDNVPMTVVFEVRSPNDGDELMQQKLEFYDEHEVEEYYLLDPNPTPNTIRVYQRRGGNLGPRRLRAGKFTSPRLGIRFDLTGPEAVVFSPTGERFLTFAEEKTQRMRLAELSRKARLGQASPDEIAELERLEEGSA
jgi:Uma2 family endonuclease